MPSSFPEITIFIAVVTQKRSFFMHEFLNQFLN